MFAASARRPGHAVVLLAAFVLGCASQDHGHGNDYDDRAYRHDPYYGSYPYPVPYGSPSHPNSLERHQQRERRTLEQEQQSQDRALKREQSDERREQKQAEEWGKDDKRRQRDERKDLERQQKEERQDLKQHQNQERNDSWD